MNALPWMHRDSAVVADAVSQPVSSRTLATRRSQFWTLFAILTAFWAYVTMSNILYANSMQAGFGTESGKRIFAVWDVRLLQHVFLFPVFISCVFAAVRVGWHTFWKRLPVQIILGAVFAVLASPMLGGAEHLLSGSKGMDPQWQVMKLFDRSEFPAWIASATSFLLTYGFGVALATGFTFYRRMRDSELRYAEMEQAWSAARLSALRMQLSPHTLFNLLNTIRGHIAWDPTTAQSMVVQLADLLRQLLNAGEREYSRLGDELNFARLYLGLQQKRFADRLTVSLPASDSIPNAWVPSLILQPLIENAVVHGLADHQRPVEISVTFALADDELTLQVRNNFAANVPADHNGIGVRNVAERLRVQFGAKAQFSSGPDARGDWVATIRIPALREPSSKRA